MNRNFTSALFTLCLSWTVGCSTTGGPAQAHPEIGSAGQAAAAGQLALPASSDTLGARLFVARCATCHTEEPGYAPARPVLTTRTVDQLVGIMTHGAMANMAQGLSTEEIDAIARYLSRVSTADAAAATNGDEGYCREPGGPVRLTGSGWNGWSPDPQNSRFHPNPGISAADVPRLRVKWAFRYPIRGGVFSQPTVVGDHVFVSSIPGDMYSLDRETGCIHWSYSTEAGARTAVVVGPLPSPSNPSRLAAYVGDNSSWVHAVDAQTGEQIWRVRVEDHPGTRLTGSPILHEGRLFVPVSSLEEASAVNEAYECCTFRGSVVALDPITGATIWKSYTIPEEPKAFDRTSVGTIRRGPSGAAIWGAPTLDQRRNVLYVTTGNSYTDVTEPGSRAVIAMDLGDGRIRWSKQIADDDNYLVSCLARPQLAERAHANCPEHVGPDHDFGASAIIRSLPDGRQILLAADKGGVVFGLDPDADGRLLWTIQVSHGSTLGGIQWGMAADDEYVYVASADDRTFPREAARPNVTALRIATGEVVWQTPAPIGRCSWSGDVELCGNGYSAALTLIPGVVFAPNLDGHLRALSARDGSLLWEFDTARLYDAVNGRAQGGSIDAAGVTVVDGMVFVNSGYDRFTRRLAGNVLLAFSVDGR
jgi:polyvinyl alcohol dehydrogenase (cytochrome)